MALCTEEFPADLRDAALAEGWRVLDLEVADGVTVA